LLLSWLLHEHAAEISAMGDPVDPTREFLIAKYASSA
jgi:hypothetical protein